jgi:hypothetical protein
MVRDSVSAMTNNPLMVHDLFLNADSPVPHQLQFIPFNASWGETNQYGFGGTSLVEVDYASATGMSSPLVIFENPNCTSQGQFTTWWYVWVL